MSANAKIEPQVGLRLSHPQQRSNCESPRVSRWLVLILVWALSAAYTAHLLKRGWVPFDEGVIGQCAERVHMGELPHRDFEDPYTGGLSYLNALAFSTVGTNSAGPRIVLFLFFLAFVPTVFWIAARFASPLGAVAATLLSVVWSLPNYPAALPSWYNLYFAVFGMAAALKFLETGRLPWIFLAGLCGGISFLFKVSGLYFVAAICLTLFFREVSEFNQEADESGHRNFPVAYALLEGIFLSALVMGLFSMVRHHLSAAAIVEFVLPGTALAALCLWRCWRATRAPSSPRFVFLFRSLWSFLLGVFVPLAVFLVPYVRVGALRDFVDGVFLLPMRRFDYAFWEPSGFSLARVVATLTVAGLIAAGMCAQLPLNWRRRTIVLLALGFTLLAAGRSFEAYQFFWSPLTLLIPIAVLGGMIVLATPRFQIASLRQQQIVLLLAVAALCSLVQLPWAVPVYFCYVAPLLVLALLALVSVQPHPSRFLLGSLTAFYIAFAVLWFTPTFISYMGWGHVPDYQTYRLTLPRAGGLRVDRAQGQEWEQVIRLVEEHHGNSGFVYCAPDCPEIAFLSGLRNPTSILFDFFDDQARHTEYVLQAIEAHQVRVVAIHTIPPFSRPIPASLRAALRQRFPEFTYVGDFEVRWMRGEAAEGVSLHSPFLGLAQTH